jgi:hypothetical protein
VSDYLDRTDLLALGFDEPTVDLLLSRTPHRGHEGRPIIPADDLPNLLAQLGKGGAK